MRRKSLLYLLLVVVIAGAIPFIVGVIVEKQFDDVLATLSDSTFVEHKLVDYKRGWIKSVATTRFNLPDIAAGTTSKSGKNYSVLIDHTVHHGPFIKLPKTASSSWQFGRAVIYSDIKLSDQAKSVLAQQLDSTDLVKLQTNIGIDGSIDLSMFGDRINLVADHGTNRTAWNGIRGSWQISKDLKEIRQDLIMPGFDLDINGSNFTAKDMHLFAEITRTIYGLWVGTEEFNMKSFSSIDHSTKDKLQIDGFSYSARTNLDNTSLKKAGRLKIDKLSVPEYSFGPANCEFVIDKFSAPHLQKIFGLIKKYQGLNAAQKQANPLNKQVEELIFALLNNRPEFHINRLTIITDDGPVEGMLHVSVGGNNLRKDRQDLLLKSITVNAKLNVPQNIMLLGMQAYYQFQLAMRHAMAGETITDEEMLRQAEELAKKDISTYLQQGLIVDNGKSYSTYVEIAHGRLTVNNKVLTDQLF